MKSLVAAKPDALASIVELFSTRPRELPCGTCGRTLAAHSGNTPDCAGFSRPALPPTFAYVDQLESGDAFEFLSIHRHTSGRVATRAPFDLDATMGLLQLESHTSDSVDVIHLVERNTIVHLTAAGA